MLEVPYEVGELVFGVEDPEEALQADSLPKSLLRLGRRMGNAC